MVIFFATASTVQVLTVKRETPTQSEAWLTLERSYSEGKLTT